MIFKMMKDIVDEFNGIDIEQKHRIEREEREKAEQEYKEKNFAPLWVKRSALVIAIFYVIISCLMIYGYFNIGKIFAGICTIFLLICSTVGGILINLKDKKKQKIGCIIFGIFLIIQTAKSFIFT